MHLLIDFEVTILSSHAPVKKFIKVYEAVFTFDTHSKKMLFSFVCSIMLFTESKTFGSILCSISSTKISKFSEKVKQEFFFDFETFILILSKLLPYFLECIEITFEFLDHVIFWEVVLFKLLNNN